MRTRVQLGDAVSALIDHRGKTPKKLGGDWSAAGHRVLSALNIKDNRVNDNDHHYVDRQLYAKWMKEPLRAGDVLLTSEAPTGEVAYISDDVDWALGQRLFALRGKPGVLDGRYLSYLLRGGDVRHQLMSRSTGTTVTGIRQSELVKIELDLPPVGEQRAVAATLGALDDKIDSDRRSASLSNELVDALALRLLRDRPTERFALADVVTFNAANAEPGRSEFIDYIDIASVAPGRIIAPRRLRWKEAPSRARRAVADGDVIFSTVRPGRRSFALIIEPSPSAVASTGFAVMTPSRRIGSSLLVSIAASADFAGYLESVAHGSAYPAVSVEAMGKYGLVLPKDERDIADFEKLTMPLRRHAAQKEAEAQRLAALRDALLPGLLAGSLTVNAEVGSAIQPDPTKDRHTVIV